MAKCLCSCFSHLLLLLLVSPVMHSRQALCAVPFVNKRFEIYWNVPSGVCSNSSGHQLDPAKFGIRTNDKQVFHGSEIVTFYEDQLGYYPKCEYEQKMPSQEDSQEKYSVKECVHGGLPQNADLKKHLAKVKKDIEKAIPNKKFSGPVVIDWEHWRPIYGLNWGARTIYKVLSTKDVQQKYPSLSEGEAQRMGEDLFNKAARKLMRETLQLAKKLRPQGQWGWYDFPLCNYDAGEGGEWECATKFRTYNLQLGWMYEQVNAFYPPIYLYDQNEKSEKEKRYVHARIQETRALQKKLSKMNTPIYLFSKIEYSPYELNATFYNTHSLCNSLDYPADNAVKGVILWSSSNQIALRCARIRDYVDAVLGPKIEKIQTRVFKCSRKVCSNHGRCQLKQPARDFGCGDEHYTEHFSCRCDSGYTGEYCEHKSRKFAQAKTAEETYLLAKFSKSLNTK